MAKLMKPSPSKGKFPQFQSWQILAVMGLLASAIDRVWFALDRSVPSWDPADYLIGSMNYWRFLQNPQWLSADWWQELWRLSSKIPPLTYIATVPFLNVLGTGVDAATIVNLLFSAVLLASVYGLGKHLFDRRVGLWAAGLCLLLPGLYRIRLDFLLDYPLTAAVTLAFFCLTVWRDRSIRQTPFKWKHACQSLLWAIAFGLSLGLALTIKQTVLLFLWFPLLWVMGEIVGTLAWGRLLQLLAAFLVSVPIWGGWYRANWLLILTSGKRATIDSALAEGDPPLNSIAAWTYYWQRLPEQVSFVLLLIPLAGFAFYFSKVLWNGGAKRWKKVELKARGRGGRPVLGSPQTKQLLRQKVPGKVDPAEGRLDSGSASGRSSSLFPVRAFVWLAVFWVGAYLLWSVNVNKDFRYVLPYLPVTAIALAWGLLQWAWFVRVGTVAVAMALCILNLFPIDIVALPGWLRSPHFPYMGAAFPHAEVIAEIVNTEPYLRSTLGVLPSTAQVNQHNFSYYGSLADFQVYGRQVGVRESQVAQDGRSLSWFLMKTGDQGSVPPSQAQMVQTIATSPEFAPHRQWSLPDGSTLQLYRRKSPLVAVYPLSPTQGSDRVQLDRVLVPSRVPPGFPVPLTYVWSGNWQSLRSGLVLLTWKPVGGIRATLQTSETFVKSNVTSKGKPSTQWLHDRAIGMGQLVDPVDRPTTGRSIVSEGTAMLPPANIAPGTYTLDATYLNRDTGERYPISMPSVTLTVDPKALPLPAQELDWVTQLRQVAAALPQGVAALEPLFETIARINQYDPIQDYLEQTVLTLESRLQQDPQNADWAYTIGLARVLQKQLGAATAAFERVVKLDGQNPNAHAYLAFLNLCDFRPRAAQRQVEAIAALDPQFRELPILRGVTALMRGDLQQVWRDAAILLRDGRSN